MCIRDRDEVYRVVTATRNNSRGTTCDETQKTLASSLSSTLERKVISIDPRGNASEQWSEYGPGAVRTVSYTHLDVYKRQGVDSLPVLHKEPLTFENVHLAIRSYK